MDIGERVQPLTAQVSGAPRGRTYMSTNLKWEGPWSQSIMRTKCASVCKAQEAVPGTEGTVGTFLPEVT